jgi:hypothetical protein
VKRTVERQLNDIDSFSRPFHGLRRETPLIPAMNRWAIVSRPPGGLKPDGSAFNRHPKKAEL